MKDSVESDEEYARKLQKELNQEGGIEDEAGASNNSSEGEKIIRDLIIRLPEDQRNFNAALFGAMVKSGFEKLYNAKGISDVVIHLYDSDENTSKDNTSKDNKDNKDNNNINNNINNKDNVEKLYAHKMVLSVWSETFSKLLADKEVASTPRASTIKKEKNHPQILPSKKFICVLISLVTIMKILKLC